MSTPIDRSQALEIEFQTYFGTIAEASSDSTEWQRLVQLCKELLAQRHELREVLTRTQAERDQYLKALGRYMAKEYPQVDYDLESLLKEVVQEPPLQELLAELEREEESRNGR